MKVSSRGWWVPLLALLVSGCLPLSGGGDTRPMQTRNPPDGYVLGDDKAFYINERTPDVLRDAERRIRRIPGIVDAHIITFRDTVIVGVLTDGRTTGTDRRVHVDTPYNAKTPETRIRPATDGYNNQIVNAIRPRLQSETRFNVLLIATDQVSFARIADIKRRVQAGQPVSAGEYNKLMNDIGMTKEPFNLVD